jgi:hypothetical protein
VKLCQHAPRSEYGSFASMDRSHLPAERAAYLSHSGSNILRPQQQHPLALHPPSTLVPPGACSATASERNQRRRPARLFAIVPFLSSTLLSLSPLHSSDERGSASTRALRTHTHTHKCGRVFASCEIHSSRHFNLLDDLPSCHSSSSTASRCCDYCHVIPYHPCTAPCSTLPPHNPTLPRAVS